MKQVIQSFKTGKLELAEVPIPVCSPNTVLIKNMASLISIGTERSLIELGKLSLLGKAKARPELVKRFVEKAKNEGLIKTVQEALNRLDNPVGLGYSSAGLVLEAGSNVNKFSPGDQVACIGAGYAAHAEYITVPENLCCKIPDRLSAEEASFGMVGIIALHGVRCTQAKYGETVAVIGLGLLGLLTLQILHAYGFKVIGMDIDQSKVALARKLNTGLVFATEDDFKNALEAATSGYGADAIIVTTATDAETPVNTAVQIAKFGAKIVVVGVADIHPQRNEMWHKEVEIIVSKAGGPGIFDPFYENKGIDYPLGLVRWTENRNLGEFLRLIAENKINVKDLISHRYNIETAEEVYHNLLENKGGPFVGVVFSYPDSKDLVKVEAGRLLNNAGSEKRKGSAVSLGVIGAGLFGKSVLLPKLLKVKDIHLHTLATSSGHSSYHTGVKFGFEKYTTDYKQVLNNSEINSVIILTPHRQHSQIVIEAIKAHKNIFVEKPLCVNEQELREIIEAYAQHQSSSRLMVGYNRRFSSHLSEIKRFLAGRLDPLVMLYRINAGYIPSEHWVHSPEEGGSRVIGEMCHFIDLLQFLTESEPVKVYAERVSGNNRSLVNSDNMTITIKFKDGSLGTIFYSAAGDRALPREYMEIYSQKRTITMTDYRITTFFGNGRKKLYKTMNQDFGYVAELNHFKDLVLGKASAMLSPQDIFYSALCTFKVNESLNTGKAMEIRLGVS